ncbi:hypothetical protein jhhlp_008154 [Lomentospora prolificans]|uniref:Regulatory protein alcR n=1 Tax=Lomentospora prolificans TaxID=41688 RepID=A0A2N3MZP7_9PEZI|nr:hypothetical protein jhhlp_008154 [Lomentospora prolificans]
MISQANNGMISENLFRIYHDVLEHSLSCWLTEATCPYTNKRGMGGVPGQRGWKAVEQGSTWSNRIYSRVVRLDRYARSTRLIRLSQSENQAAAKALHLAIMAFTSQWAQGSRREREQYMSPPLSDGLLGADDLVQEFDRNIQISFWEQANRALQQTSGVECFRVACAELIFGLCQKPWDSDEIEPIDHLESRLRNVRGSTTNNTSLLMAKLEAAIAKDGTPIHMENAARKANVLKFRWDSRRLSLTGGQAGDLTSSDDVNEHGRTVGLVYWLAVMFDTVSSSMNERPVVVADEDSQHCDASTEEPSDDASPRPSSNNGQVVRRWSTPLFIQDDPNRPVHTPRWPCSYEAAAEAVTRSGPVKVLLYRHVLWLQNALRRRERPDCIEDIIQDTMSLYRYWNATYGAFFKELVRNFPKVPVRIQSWFFCISAHWHLAALMFANLVDFIDENQFGVAEISQTRLQNRVAERIKKASANEISDLANVSVPPDAVDPTYCDNSTFQSQPSPDFHFAVNKCTILTEPWTMLIIRAFTKAGAMHLSQAQDLWHASGTDLGHEGETCEESLRRCEECIKALWFLGKKSDMARSTAGLLSQALSDLSARLGQFENGAGF